MTTPPSQIVPKLKWKEKKSLTRGTEGGKEKGEKDKTKKKAKPDALRSMGSGAQTATHEGKISFPAGYILKRVVHHGGEGESENLY